MKQTTIQLNIEETLFGAAIFAGNARGKFFEHTPTKYEEKAFKLLCGERAQWGLGFEVAPKGELPDNENWWHEFSNRFLRVCAKRKYKTKVRILERFPNGNVRKAAVTVFWDKEVKVKDDWWDKLKPSDKELNYSFADFHALA